MNSLGYIGNKFPSQIKRRKKRRREEGRGPVLGIWPALIQDDLILTFTLAKSLFLNVTC